MGRIHNNHAGFLQTRLRHTVDRQLSAASQQSAQNVRLSCVTQCQLNATHTAVLLPSAWGNEACDRQCIYSFEHKIGTAAALQPGNTRARGVQRRYDALPVEE